MERSISPCLDHLYPFDTDTIGGANDNPSEISVVLIPCSTCNRTFAAKALQKHARICEKAASKKRKPFDSSRQRREGTDLASYPLPKGYGLPPIRQERGISPKPMQQQHQHQQQQDPRQQPHQQPISPKKPTEMLTKNSLRSSIRKEAATANSKSTPSLSGGPSAASITKERSRVSVVKRIQPPSSEQCPYCDRNFGIKAYDRHVEWCKEKSLIASIKSNNTNSRVKAKERLEARTKYKAPSLKSKRSVNRDKYSGVGLDDDNESQFDDNSKFNISSSMTSSVMSDSVLSDKYDPFLSAKRQLEELCSPTTPTDLLAPFTTSTPTNSNSNTKSILNPIISPLKMTSSLNLNPLTSSPNPRRILTTVKSNFRRTNSLRAATHKSSMLSSRPLFIPPYKQRPTIQRGLSDEGPISSSFLKPEEYDEMPVRSVCVNDFAISNSPRIVRRDTSVSNRKNNMRLPVGNSNSTTSTTTTTTGHNSIAANANCSGKDESSTASKFLSKTDSLAAFLRYENEVENSVNSSSGTGPLITKELKDKSNALSKQNSAKSIQSEAPEFFKSDENKTSAALKTQRVLEKAANTSSQNFEMPSKLNGVRLEPLTKPISNEMNSIFDETSNSNTQSLSNDRHNSSSSEFIDPKLINICDNLPINIDSSLSNASKNSDTDSSIEFALSNKNPLISDRKEDDDGDSSLSPAGGKSNKIILPGSGGGGGGGTNCNRNSSEGRNFLKRKMRLGRNQFLYDASPDADYCSADDEANRSSMECDDKLFNHQSLRGHKKSADGSSGSVGGCDLPPISSSIPPIPIFDDFDFEEFLSSFENDEDQFPLFKDCREFLINRTSNKSNRATKNIAATQNNNSTNSSPQSQQQSQTQMSHFHKNFIQSTQIPQKSSCSSSSLRSPTINDSSSSSPTENELQHEDKKREIFISIETDQIDLGGRHHGGDDGGRDADSLRMAGNSQARVEEVDPNDNKFSKILDEDYRDAGDTIRVGGGRNREIIPCEGSSTLPNVKLNNAKNLIKQIHDDFRQMAKTKDNDRTNRDRNLHQPTTATGDRDSDEMNSSVECFPISASSSRRGGGDSVVSKTCADSAYGSLSRQRSSELQRHHSRNRPSTATSAASTIPSLDAQQKLMQQNQANLKYSTAQSESKKYRSQQFSGSSSGSENSFPPININQQLSQHHSNQHYQHNNREQINRNTTNSNNNNNNQRFQRSYENNSKNNNHSPLSSPSPTMAAPSSAPYQSLSRTPSNLSGSMKLSRFCHECGSKFLIEQAKFCMDCGVKRIAL